MGYSVVTTVLAPAANYDLTDLPTAKTELSIASNNTANDAWLELAIGQVSKSIQRHCKRPFAPEYLQDQFDIEQDPYPYQTPGGFPQLQLTRWPVLAVVSVVQTLAIGTTQALVEGTDFRVNAKTGQLLRLNPFTGVGTTWEAIPVTVLYSAGFGALVEETDTVPGAPYQVTVSQAAAFSADQGVAYASGVALTPVTANPVQGEYAVDGATGTYTFAAGDTLKPLSFAYTTLEVPDDLVEITLRLITDRFRARGRDPLLIQRDQPNLGTERYWFDSSLKSRFPPEIEDELDDYRVPTMA
jgi:hypothetical protein